jgi:hypothetical protein
LLFYYGLLILNVFGTSLDFVNNGSNSNESILQVSRTGDEQNDYINS